MNLVQAKIYNDGSHYIAIRRTKKPKRPKKVKKERVIIVDEKETILQVDNEPTEVLENDEITILTGENDNVKEEVKEPEKALKKPKELTLKELFNSFYTQTVSVKKKDRKKIIQKAMRKYFDDEKSCIDYVQENFERVERNLLSRKIRFSRKVNMHAFNYFCTFTYDSELHTEESFKKKLKCFFYNMTKRHGWRYIGVWERSPVKERLHYHGLFIIPDISIVGELEERKDYNTISHRMQTVKQSKKILVKFGRNDFREIDKGHIGWEALKYILKYIEKTGTKIDSSGKLPAYVIGDVLSDDIMCNYGDDENKFVLADNFLCVYQGEILGEVSHETLKLMPKEN